MEQLPKKLLSLLLALTLLFGCAVFASADGEPAELSITNNTGMFKAVTASLADGGSVLVVALSGTGYQHLFKGTYEQAVANGDDRDNWIPGALNTDGKWEFRVPLAAGESYIPVVAVSSSYLSKYEQGENSLQRAFYPRQFVVDAEAKTLVTGDYEHTSPLSLTNASQTLSVSSAELSVVGGPNSNNYKAVLDLTVSGSAFDKAFVGSSSDITAQSTLIDPAEGVFSIPTKRVAESGKPETLVNLLASPFTVSFRNAESGQWSEYGFAVDESAASLTISDASSGGEPVELGITNNTGMFKAVSASLDDGGSVLVVALSGTGYQHLFKGTYEQAVANGDDRDNWIPGALNTDGKWEFRIPLAAGENYIPVVAVSSSYLSKYEQGENSLQRAFYPRQFVVDAEAKTLVTGDYEHTSPLSLTNASQTLSVSSAALSVVGGPNSNNYKSVLDLTVSGSAFDKAFVGSSSDVTAQSTLIDPAEGVFSFPAKRVAESGKPETLVNLLASPFTVSFRNAESGQWSEYTFTVSESAASLAISDASSGTPSDPPAAVPFDYAGDSVCFINAEGTGFGMFTAQEGTTCVINGDNAVIHFVPKNTTVYGALHFGAITDAELTADVTFNDDGSFDLTLPKASYCGKAVPVAPVKKSDGGTTSAQYYLAVPAANLLQDVTSSVTAAFDYAGSDVCFIKEDGTGFGMFTAQEGTTCVINGDNAVIHFVPKNTTVYGALHFGAVTDAELTADVTFNDDGSFDLTLPKASYCGKAVPIAPVKKSDGGTTSAQYYLAVPAADLLQDVTPSASASFDYAGDSVCFINSEGAGFGMFTAQDGTTCVINGDNVVIHFVPKNTTVYGALHFGTVTDAELTADVTFNDDGSFDLTLPKASYCGKAVPIAPVKKSDGGTTSGQYYLAVPAADLLQDVTNVDTPADYSALDAALASVPADLSVYTDSSVQALNSAVGAVVRDLKAPDQARVDAMARAVSSAVAGLKLKSSGTGSGTGSGGGSDKDTDESTELSVTNNTGMFKVVTALLETKNGRTELIVTLSGSTYHELFKGNYAQAVANGNNRSKWIHGYTNDDGKWEFRIPVSSGESYIPCVSISSTYLSSFEAGENPVERAFYPRQFVIDKGAKTLTVGDYDETVTFSVTSSSKSFRVSSSARVRVVGGPNSNNFNVAPVLQMLDDTYDRLTYPTVVDGSIGEATAELSSNRSFSINMLNAPTKEAFRDKEPISIGLRKKSDGSTVTYEMVIDLLAKTVSISGGDGEDGGDSSDSGGKDGPSDDAEGSAQTSEAPAGTQLNAETVDGAARASVGAGDIAGVAVGGTAVFSVQSGDGADTVMLELSADALKAADGDTLAVTVNTALGAVKLSADDVNALAGLGAAVTLSVSTGEDGAVTLDVSADGRSVEMNVKAELPEDGENKMLVIVKEDGSEEIIRKSVSENGKMYAIVPAGATVKSVDAGRSFTDVKADSWYGGAVAFVSGRGLFKGTSDSEFSPSLPMTRAMLVTVLYRLENEPEAPAETAFADVKEGSWYSEAVAWAAENGIVKGVGGDSFGTNDSITREQIATILYRYALYIGADVSAGAELSEFPDGGEVSSWADEAMSWAVGAGLFRGDDTGALRPGDDASRAEVAELIRRMTALIVK